MGTRHREDRSHRMAFISPSHSCLPPSQPCLISFSLHPSFSLSSSWSESLLPQNLTLANFNKKSVYGKGIKNSQILQQDRRKKPIRLWRQLCRKSTYLSNLHHSHQKPGMTWCMPTATLATVGVETGGMSKRSVHQLSSRFRERSCLGVRIHIIFLWFLHVHTGMYTDMNAHIPSSQHTH